MSYDRRIAAEPSGDFPEADVEFGEIQVADYLVFLFSVDTYLRYLQETEKQPDDVIGAGLALIRRLERQHLDTIGNFIRSNLASQQSLKFLEAALRQPPTARGLATRALKIRMVLSRGGSATARAVFGSSTKARREVLDAIDAASTADPDQALAKLAVIVLRDKRLEKWIDMASDSAQPMVSPNISPANEAAKAATDQTSSLLQTQLQQSASTPGSDVNLAAGDAAATKVEDIRATATEAAKKALARTGDEDGPVTKSEAAGIAAATAAAVITNSAIPNNVPPSLAKIADDPEKMEAVRQNGRVLLAAGAGSGKTQLLTARISYLIQERGAKPNRIFAVAFNKKAAKEIQDRLKVTLGDEIVSEMALGTMHAIFRGYIIKYGSAEQKAALTTWFIGKPDEGKQDKSGRQQFQPRRGPTPATLGGTMARIWRLCKQGDPPSNAAAMISKWQMNNITPAQAKADAIGAAEEEAAEWYEWQLGFKGVNKSWAPPCVRSNYKANGQWSKFLADYRDNGRARLGDFSDMIVMFRDLLRDNPQARKEIQKQFDHICVDEAQDLNEVQHEIIDHLSGHIGDGSDGKSLWLVGDEIQSINAFIGAKPELFTQFDGKVDPKTGAPWKTLNISTNYRCLPEILKAANQLMANHPRGIPMETKPHGAKPVGEASIIVDRPDTNADGAVATVTRIQEAVEAGTPISNFGVLSRTNAELNDYETACIIMGVPYGRRGGNSFLQAYETQTVLNYMDVITGSNFKTMQEAMGKIFDKPNRAFLGASGPDKVAQAYSVLARRKGVDISAVDPMDIFTDEGLRLVLEGKPNWAMADSIGRFKEMEQHLRGMRTSVDRAPQEGEMPYTTQQLIDDILAIPGAPEADGKPRNLRSDIMPLRMQQSEEEGDDPETLEEERKKPVGNVAFLYLMAMPNSRRTDMAPENPRQFKAYLDKLAEGAKDLRVDLKAWDDKQAETIKNPADRKPPPCVVLSTVHSMKGAQFKDTTVIMQGDKFPMPPFPLQEERDGTLTPDQEIRLAARREKDFLTERQLAYVAMTRAEKNLTIICPEYNAKGKPIGPSMFVREANLKKGQNVAGQPEPESALLPTDLEGTEGRTVMASVLHRLLPYAMDVDQSFFVGDGANMSYDRRQS